MVCDELKKREKKELTEQFYQKSENYFENCLEGHLDINLEKDLIQNIIEKEDSRNNFKGKIIDEIKNIRNDRDKNKIDHLTILLVGNQNVGKTTLIKYMLGLSDDEIENIKNDNENGDFVTYKSNKVSYLHLVEFKGIGYEENNDPETIGRKTQDFINGRYRNNDYNEFIHCIWYCVSFARYQKPELNVLKKLKEVYPDSIMPIIIVYTQVVDKAISISMEKYIKKQGLDISYINVVAKRIILPNNSGYIDEFGDKELLNLTLQKCTEALEGKMSNLMIKMMSTDIKKELKNRNKKMKRR